MPLGNLSNQISHYFKPSQVSALGNLLGYSTQIGNSTRSYIRNFWEKGTAKPYPGHMHHGKRLNGYNKNLYVSDKLLYNEFWLLLEKNMIPIILAYLYK